MLSALLAGPVAAEPLDVVKDHLALYSQGKREQAAAMMSPRVRYLTFRDGLSRSLSAEDGRFLYEERANSIGFGWLYALADRCRASVRKPKEVLCAGGTGLLTPLPGPRKDVLYVVYTVEDGRIVEIAFNGDVEWLDPHQPDAAK